MNALMPAPSAAPYNVALDDDEWRLIRSLREIPPSPLRDRMREVIDALVAFVANPGCPELQADGVPCSRTLMVCERCRRVLSLLGGMRRRLPPPSGLGVPR
jgi:hypothetical protein